MASENLLGQSKSLQLTKGESAMVMDSRQVANTFIEQASLEGNSLSILPLIKLVYMAHGWSLALRDAPLITDFAYAWKHGPVIPAVYFAFRPQGTRNLSPTPLLAQPMEEGELDVIEQTFDRYAHMPARQLRSITHVPGGPWYRTWTEKGPRAMIPNELIKEHYLDKLMRLAEFDSA